MTTVNQIVTSAFRKLDVAGVGETLDADDLAEGVSVFNAMMFGLELKGVDVSHATQVESDDFALDAKFEEGATYILASRLSPNYGIPPEFNQDDWLRTLQAAYTVVPTSALPTALTRLPSNTNSDYTS